MIILANKNLPRQASQFLSLIGELVLFNTEGITYPAISGHPDVFFCPVGDGFVLAPNVPEVFKRQLSKQNISWKEGDEPVGRNYPETACYNCVVTERFVIGQTEYIDKKILEEASGKEIIHVNQGYTRCNLLPLFNNRFITSDKGIEKVLVDRDLEVLYVNPECILLPGFKHGFIGGTAGILEDHIFFLGSLDHFLEGEKIRSYLTEYKIVELYDGPLFDGGGLFFIS